MFKKLFSMVTIILMSSFIISCSDDPSETQVMMTHVIKAKAIHEECLEMEVNESVNYNFDAEKELIFNIHYHEGDEVTYPVEEIELTAYTASFTAEKKQTYCLMWRNNTGDEIELSYALD